MVGEGEVCVASSGLAIELYGDGRSALGQVVALLQASEGHANTATSTERSIISRSASLASRNFPRSPSFHGYPRSRSKEIPSSNGYVSPVEVEPGRRSCRMTV